MKVTKATNLKLFSSLSEKKLIIYYIITIVSVNIPPAKLVVCGEHSIGVLGGEKKPPFI